MHEFSNTDMAVFAVVGQSVFPHRVPLAPALDVAAPVDWVAVMGELRAQTVFALGADWMAERAPRQGVAALSADLREAWLTESVVNVRNWIAVMEGQRALVELLHAHDIPVAILKGAAAGQYYPRPEYRAMGDVDFLVPLSQRGDCYRLLRAHGYEDAQGGGAASLYQDAAHHAALIKDGVEFELHWRLAAKRRAGRFERQLPPLLKTGLAQVETIKIEGYEIPVLPCELNGIVLLRHIMQHLQAYELGLRQLVDWMLFVDACLADAAWDGGFGERARSLGLDQLACHATRACQLYLGLREEGITWCRAASPELAADFLACLMRAGNFGRKEAGRNKGLYVFTRRSGAASALLHLQRDGASSWPALAAHPGLRPLAWAWKLQRYVRRVLEKDAPFRDTMALMERGRAHEGLLERLGIPANLQRAEAGSECGMPAGAER